MRIVERAAGVEQDKACRKGIVCVPIWHCEGGDVSRVPRYTTFALLQLLFKAES